MQAPTSKRQGLRENISQFCNFIVGASIARPLKPCAAARPPGWSKAPPPQYTARECVKFLSPFCNSTVGAGLGSARMCRTLALAFCPAAHTEHPRPCRTCKPENTPPHRWRACGAGPYKQKARLTQIHPQPFLLYSRGEHCSPALAERWLLRFAPQPTPNTPALAAPANPKIHSPPFLLYSRGEHCSPAYTAAANPQILTPHS